MLIEAVRERALDHSGSAATAKTNKPTIIKPCELCLLTEFFISYSS
jgi:hypothetical protein